MLAAGVGARRPDLLDVAVAMEGENVALAAVFKQRGFVHPFNHAYSKKARWFVIRGSVWS